MFVLTPNLDGPGAGDMYDPDPAFSIKKNEKLVIGYQTKNKLS